MSKDVDTKILELSIKAISEQLDSLLKDCVDEKGKPKAPSMRSIMTSRASLPYGYEMSVHK